MYYYHQSRFSGECLLSVININNIHYLHIVIICITLAVQNIQIMKQSYSFRLDKGVIHDVDVLAAQENRTRSNMVEELLIRQLNINLNSDG